ncbi:MAG: hypothetical protein JRI34_03810 [Deltaproteobacteria bacterium]|nr:hypothetical protein [Deltaproteobacteria bacterium]
MSTRETTVGLDIETKSLVSNTGFVRFLSSVIKKRLKQLKQILFTSTNQLEKISAGQDETVYIPHHVQRKEAISLYNGSLSARTTMEAARLQMWPF